MSASAASDLSWKPASHLGPPHRPFFPQIIADVLAEHGDDIDAAIKHLTELRLATPSSSTATPEQQAAAAAAVAEQHAAEQQRQQQQQGAQQGAAPQQAQQQQGEGSGAAQPRSADEWIDVVVREMAAASDMADARARASKVLQAFEQAAVQHAKQQVGGRQAGGGGSAAGLEAGAVGRVQMVCCGLASPAAPSLLLTAACPACLPAPCCRARPARQRRCAASWPRRCARTSCSSARWPSRTRACRS